jgi:hypothetical protein
MDLLLGELLAQSASTVWLEWNPTRTWKEFTCRNGSGTDYDFHAGEIGATKN